MTSGYPAASLELCDKKRLCTYISHSLNKARTFRRERLQQFLDEEFKFVHWHHGACY